MRDSISTDKYFKKSINLKLTSRFAEILYHGPSSMSIFLITGMLSLFLTLGCGLKPTDSSKVYGHFEESNFRELNTFKGQVIVPPEYAPTKRVMISWLMLKEHHMEDFASELLKSGLDWMFIVFPNDFRSEEIDLTLRPLHKLLNEGERKKIVPLKTQVSGKTREWARDWAPLRGNIKDKYHHLNSSLWGNSSDVLIDFNYYSERQADDFVPRALSQLTSTRRMSLPLYHEGGNFMNTWNGDCFLTDRIVSANARKEIPRDKIYSQNDIKKFFHEYLGCKQTIIFPSMPFEGTRHIDIWAKLVDDHRVVIHDLEDELLGILSPSSESYRKATLVKEFLDHRAKDFQALGYEVIRMPMPLPIFGNFNLFRSFANSLFVNGRVFVPHYSLPKNAEDGTSGRYIDDEFLPSIQERVRSQYKELGFEVIEIPSDHLITKGGAIHCATMTL